MNEEGTMLDIVERLESIADWGGTTNVVAICRDAKTEIDRLRAENAEMREVLDKLAITRDREHAPEDC